MPGQRRAGPTRGTGSRQGEKQENPTAIMQRSIMSFFQPQKEGKVKKPEKDISQETESLSKALKERNGAFPEGDSPVKRPKRKVTRVLGSEGEEEDEALTPPRGQASPPSPDPVAPSSPALPSLSPVDISPQASPPSPDPAVPSSPAPPSSSPVDISPSGIPKRRTARKQLPKRTIQDVLEEQGEDGPGVAKRKRSEKAEAEPSRGSHSHTEAEEEGGQPSPRPEAESPAPRAAAPEVAGKQEPQEPQEDTQTPLLPRAPKTLSSFFAPRKPTVKKEVKEEAAETPGKEGAKGPPEPACYNPAKGGYHPVDDACWRPGQKVPYLAVARTFEKIEEVSARLRMVETLSNLLRSVVALSPSDLLPILYLSLNRLGPPQQGLELGVGDGVLLKAVAQATGRQLESVRAEAAEKGDVGLVAESSRSTQRLVLPPPPLSASGVFAKFQDIARLSGTASTTKKMEIIKCLFVACRHSEARYIARALSGRLRLGLAEQSVLAALAQAVSLTPPGQGTPPAVVDAGKGKTTEARKMWLEEQAMTLKQTFCEVPDLDRIVPVLLEHGLEQLPEHCRLSPGTPLKPMLAHPTRGVSEVLKRFEEAAFTCEYKYDGQRAQIHVLEGGEVKIFSRNQEDNTGKYPDIISRIPKIKLPSVTSFILDTEAVAWDREKKQIQPFQVLTTRKRKETDAAEIRVQVCLYAFDLIYLNGESLVREPLSRRRQLLRENFVETEGEFVFATSLDTKDTEQIAEFLEQSVRDSCEGLMVKTLDVDATYEIAKRSHNWLKLKKDYLEGVGDTLDLVVIGAYLGRGKRAGRYGGFLLAAYDEESEEFQAICKLGTGFSDEELEEHHQRLQTLLLPAPRSYVRAEGAVAPDHWLEPSTVWEVKCADLSLSPIYPAARGLVDSEKGISLRFPRFIRVRDDKKPEQATTSAQVACLYKKQSQIQNQQGAESDSDREDFY
ncbi:DNA ligase 1 isoform X2 [Sorex araneus]|uniref:DNA ligase 1 isoform X2 n=1 Tax=Sorex araneus TaxID=42254 RepID=UPI0024334CAA|nr:DNA ligase 1 isoform X2 [Sorex araneus]